MGSWLEIGSSAMLIATGAFVLASGPSRLSGKGASWGEVRDLAMLLLLLGSAGAGFTVYIFLRGAK